MLTEPYGTCGTGFIVISTAAQLAAIGDKDNNNYPLNGKYCLVNVIALTDYQTGEGWVPIGSRTTTTDEDAPEISDPFTGIFDGNNHKITGLYINRPGADYQGLFGYFKGGASEDI